MVPLTGGNYSSVFIKQNKDATLLASHVDKTHLSSSLGKVCHSIQPLVNKGFARSPLLVLNSSKTKDVSRGVTIYYGPCFNRSSKSLQENFPEVKDHLFPC